MITSSIYNSNATMRIIGMQNTEQLAPVSADIQNVLDAYSTNGGTAESMALDLLQLGLIYGKKIERARKQHRALTALQQ